MVSYKALNTVLQGRTAYRSDTLRDGDRSQAGTIRKSRIAYRSDAFRDGDRSQTGTPTEFTSRFISTICVSNGRKVTRKYIRIAEKIKI